MESCQQPDHLSSLASQIFSKQSPTLVLPKITNIPTHYAYRSADKLLPALARSLTSLGLGSLAAWKKAGRNPSEYIKAAISQWLEELGSPQLMANAPMYVVFRDVNDEDGMEVPRKARLAIASGQNYGSYGCLYLGKSLVGMEKDRAGLGRAFYVVLLLSSMSWIEVYDMDAARYYIESTTEVYRDNFECDGPDGIDFEAYCDAHGFHMPPLCEIPEYLKEIDYKKEFPSSLELLRQNERGAFADLIAPVLAIASMPEPTKERNQYSDEYDSQVPDQNWVLAFEPHDEINQTLHAEEEDRRSSRRPPTWRDTFDPFDVTDVKRVLTHVQQLAAVNLHLVRLQAATKERNSNGSIR